MKKRVDVLLVERRLAESRAQAQALVLAGLVRGVDKPVVQIEEDAQLDVERPPRFVSRGGEKLAHALDALGVAPAGRDCLDLGASTGGFTDCLLQRGARSVVAVDVGRGQLHERLRADARVVVRERTDVRALGPEQIGGPVPVVVVDVSFISLRTVLPALLGLATPAGAVVALVKPQFECGRREASRARGVVRDPAVWRRVLDGIAVALVDAGGTMMGAMVSPLTGAEGNVEFFLHALAPGAPASPGVPVVDLDAVVAEAARRHGAG